MEGQCLTQVEGIAMRPISNVVLAGGLLAGLALSPSLLASEDGVLDGCYVPVRGYAESASYSETEQLGKYRGWSSLVRTSPGQRANSSIGCCGGL